MRSMSDDEYAFAKEFFYLDKGDFSIEIAHRSKLVVALVVICLPGSIPYKKNKVIPYKYNATILEDNVEVLI